MKGFAAVLLREFLQRRVLFAGAAAAAAIPFMVPVLRGLQGDNAVDARTLTAAVIAAALGYGVIGFLAATIIPRAIADRRVAFDLSRPLSTASLWTGVCAAILCLAVGAAGMTAIPSALAGVRALGPGIELPVPVWVLAVSAVFFVLGASQAVGVALRSRSPLVILDLLLAAAWVAAAVGILDRLAWARTWVPLRSALLFLSALVPAATLVAGAAAVVRGRADIRAAHRVQTLVLWSILVPGLLGLQLWVSRLFVSRPDQLEQIYQVRPAPRGPWVALLGEVRGLPAGFLYDTVSGASLRLRNEWASPAVSADGKIAAWAEASPRSDTFAIRVSPLDRRATEAESLLSVPTMPRLLVLDEEGKRLALQYDATLTVFDLETGRRVAAAPVPDSAAQEGQRGLFVGGVFRYFRVVEDSGGAAHRLVIEELATSSERLRTLGEVRGVSRWIHVLATQDGARVLLQDIYGPRVLLADGRDGRVVAELESSATRRARATLLWDGRPLLADRGPGGWTVRVFSPDGALTRAVALPDGEHARFGSEWSPGQVVVGIGNLEGKAIFVVDVDSETARRVADGLNPAAGHGYFDAPNLAWAPGTDATRLFLAAPDGLVRLDPATGARTVLLGKGAR